MTKKIFQTAVLPVLTIALFSGILFFAKLFGDLIFPAWFHQGVLTFLKMLIWFGGGWLFNRLLSLLFWNTLIKKILHQHPPLLLVQLSSIFVLILTLSAIAHFVFHEPLTTLIAAAGGLGFVLGFAVQGLILDLFFRLGYSNGSSF
jgi:small-conductance mechanosensitive channel